MIFLEPSKILDHIKDLSFLSIYSIQYSIQYIYSIQMQIFISYDEINK